ncbi:hypothetical protein FF38_07939 [Lucilia cuprina]|uniref:Uncharacterized protein n=1 Tax=Lucilia cuprina TaxID=7375 RepID=A0A0L0BSF8_LUCCU|nr:hypothetical protein FF38_07939 [Lucilia cuprina]
MTNRHHNHMYGNIDIRTAQCTVSDMSAQHILSEDRNEMNVNGTQRNERTNEQAAGKINSHTLTHCSRTRSRFVSEFGNPGQTEGIGHLFITPGLQKHQGGGFTKVTWPPGDVSGTIFLPIENALVVSSFLPFKAVIFSLSLPTTPKWPVNHIGGY